MTTPEIQIQTTLGSDISDFIAEMGASYDATVKHDTLFQLQIVDLANTVTFHGTGFTYSHGKPTAGHVTSIDMDLGSANYARIDNLSFGLVKLFNIITGHHPEKLFDLFGDTGFTGNAGSDNMIGGKGDDHFDGKNGDDTLVGGAGGDYMVGGKGIDTASYFNAKGIGVIASLGDSSINNNDAAGDTYIGIENVAGSGYRDVLIGDKDNNVLDGGGGPDALYGGGGVDTLHGSLAADELHGGKSSDILFGGLGADRFSYVRSDLSVNSEPDRIMDWDDKDGITIDAESFGHGLVAGQALSQSQFHLDAAAGHNAQFVYFTSDGNLVWDVDGDGSDFGVIVATLQGDPAITRHDIIVVGPG